MTKAEIVTAVRNLVNEISTDAGALLSDTGNLAEYINDAMEQVTLDLIPIMPFEFMDTENVSLSVLGYATLSKTFLQIIKVEKNVTNQTPQEIPIIDPLEIQFHMNTGETAAEPTACYFIGQNIYFVPTPSGAVTDYAKVYLAKAESSTMAPGGPAMIPVIAHRLIVYQAAAIATMTIEGDPSKFLLLYRQRLEALKSSWKNRQQQTPKFVRDSVRDRETMDSRDKAFYDVGWK
jgi:hypothetical protein